ncbi:hypothetical protein A9Q84_08140 [Halobacteriovorax marinus]|uniref:DUF177 domain-containing protein n=1 Tax=Halobacteriovorax marinus TaxID=97084 RepID=A0A1Y5F5Z7_9BACT|nr:hypothetical protein A9Q84_08140 [Halobacteriovorax marinus]
MVQTNEKDNLDEFIKVESFIDEEREYHLDKSCSWVSDLLAELEENLEEKEKSPESRKMTVSLRIKRKEIPSYGEGLIVRGVFSGNYLTPCIKCLAPAAESVASDFESVFITNKFEDDEDLDETLSIWADNSELEVYFHDRGKCHVKKAVHEHLFLKINPYPLHSEECKGLCTKCGSDLNHNDCGHGAQ